ncbi:DUF4369 domain-containing protein [Flavobacterium sp. LS1P28]|uniref:DUF4369 domain-containing protein n=1 Tax=Flavobacterium bomense TaxID=2497483 RepID=A0A3S0PIA0_9FLAO|nr:MULTISPECIES: DUF4369 domain-containing protein [Flavobacterium]RTY80768.1 DUF4369 domain-containing protein [Flavobacterium sp. LS1P28]RTZ01224.1 DUF4369 domain-containing protein [Flavobacterium sp. RSP49]RTZ03888.1 DUF4369 domain-containing protein [Flavobacterium bomense]
MKKTILAFITLILLSSCNKEEPGGNVHITGNIKGLKKGTLYIQRVVDTMLVAIDTIHIDGSAVFESHLDLKSPEMLYLFLDRGVSNSMDNNLPFFAEPGKITIETSLDRYLSDATITGSKNNEIFEEFKKINSRFTDESLTLIEKKFNAVKSQNIKTIDSIGAKQDSNLKRKYLFATNFALNNRDYEVAPYIALSQIYDINIKYLDTIQKSMSPKVAKSLYGKQLTEYVATIKKQQ